MLTFACTERRADEADHAGNVGVGDVDHVAADVGVEVDALDLDEARLAVGEDRAGNRAGQVLGVDRQLDVAVDTRPVLSRLTSARMMPFSLIMIGAETMLTSATWGRMRPASSALVSALVFMPAIRPS